jgi:ATP-dependent helicase/nuclease subunit A
MPQLTATQKLALARDKNISVTAGAGTGKTLILVERYLDILIHENIDLKEVLAITFTNKAAAEMMERVAQRMNELIQETQDDEGRRKLIEYRNRISSAYISTIHSFCTRLLREYPVQAGIDPDFVQLNSLQCELLVDECIDEELEVVNSEEKKWLDLFRLFGADNIKEMLRMSLAHRYEMRIIITKYHSKGADQIFTDLVTGYLDRMDKIIDDQIVVQIYSIIGKVLAQDLTMTLQIAQALPILDSMKELYNSKQGSIEYWQCLIKLTDLFTTKQGTAYKDLGQLGTEKAWSHKVKELLLKLSSLAVGIEQARDSFPLSPPGAVDRYIIQILSQYYQLYERVAKRYDARKSERSAVDYDDLQLRVLGLLNDHEDIHNSLGRQFKYILVDEFQDTNYLQWEIISALGEITENKFFIVGDPKQSIYGFRNADVRVFNSVKTIFSQNDNSGDIVLNESFRFKEVLNTFINHIFQIILNEESDNPWEVVYQNLEIKREDAQGGKIELAFLEDASDTNSQAEFIALRIQQLINEKMCRFGDFAILLRTRTHLNEIEEQLRKNGIPFKTIGGIGFYQIQEIYDLYYLIRFIINPGDDIALIAILRSPFANISDEALFFLAVNERQGNYWQRILEFEQIKNLPQADVENLYLFREHATQWLHRRDRIGFSELLYEIFNDSQYRSILSAAPNGMQLTANITKILELSNDYEKSGFASLTDFAESLKLLINRQPKEGEAQTSLEDKGTVKLMTIHQAKGLQFPIVIVPHLEQKLVTQLRNPVIFDEENGLAAVINMNALPVDQVQEHSYFLLNFLRHKQRLKELAELKRLFYVACTRAQDHLILTQTVHEKGIAPDTPLSWLLTALGTTAESLSEGVWEYAPQKEIIIWRKSDLSQIPISKDYADQPQGEIFSATQILTFLNDKDDYFERYHLGFFEGDYDRIIVSGSEEDMALLKGKLIHRFMEAYPNFNLESVLFDLDISDVKIVRHLQQQIEKIGLRIRNSKVLKRIFSASEFKNEVQILMKLDSDFLTGTLDRIFINEKNEWEVLDYKTNKIGRQQVIKTAKKYQTQMDVYALLLATCFSNHDSYKVNLYFTEPDQIYQHNYTKSELNKIKSNLVRVIEEIKKLPPYA